MREQLIGNLCEQINGGELALLTSVNGAIAAIDALDHGPVDAETATRAVVSAVPGEPIVLTCYAEADRVATVSLEPARAVALAGRLIAAAMPRLSAVEVGQKAAAEAA